MSKNNKYRKLKKSADKFKYQIKNWREYNQSLVNRGNVTIWIGEDIRDNWYNKEHTGQQGKPIVYTDTAIETALTIREVFHLPLRQTEGFLNSLLTIMQVNLKSPDYSTLSIRGEVLPIKIGFPNSSNRPLHVVVDSTGVKIYGEGEWKVRQHGWSKHRSWRKLHLGVDANSQEIKDAQVTGNNVADSEVFPSLIQNIIDDSNGNDNDKSVIDKASGDGAYDRKSCYDILSQKNIQAIIPPQKNARIWQHGNSSDPPLDRDENLRQIRKVGRAKWKRGINYHKRSLAETCVFRLKTIFTDKVRARKIKRQTTEILLRCKILNKMTLLGMPQTIKVPIIQFQQPLLTKSY